MLKLSESEEENRAISLQAGFELGLWKSLATTINLLGLSLTSSDHGACEFEAHVSNLPSRRALTPTLSLSLSLPHIRIHQF